MPKNLSADLPRKLIAVMVEARGSGATAEQVTAAFRRGRRTVFADSAGNYVLDGIAVGEHAVREGHTTSHADAKKRLAQWFAASLRIEDPAFARPAKKKPTTSHGH